MFVPAPVLFELYAGATSHEDRSAVESLRRALGEHVVLPDLDDWILAGRCIARYTERWGQTRPRDHLADLLTAIAAVEVGGTLASDDVGQMRRWSWVLARLGRRLNVQRIRP